MPSRSTSSTRARRLVTALVITLPTIAGCPRSSTPAPSSAQSSTTPAAPRPAQLAIAETIYDGGFKNGWQDWGWAQKELVPGGPAKIHFDNYGGWMMAKPGIGGDFGGVTFRVQEPAGEGEFLEVHLIATNGQTLAKVNVGPDDRTPADDGWTEVFLPIERLDPKGVPFDRVVIQAFRPFAATPIPIDKVALTKATSARTTAPGAPAALSTMRIDCKAKATRIDPLIYGMALSDKDHATAAQLGATAVRWGGNLSSTYNRDIDAWNSGSDWFFENRDSPSAMQFLHDNAAHGVRSALTIPMMGWVAKDRTSVSFPVSALGPQDKTDPYKNEAGDGMRSGKPIPTTPQRAFVPITPAQVKAWVQAIRAEDAKSGKRSVDMYILDNEPALWNTTHRDAHPLPADWNEILQKTIDFATAIREADPDAVIAGPAEWGWTGYFEGATGKAAMLAHGNVPFVAWYLRSLADHEKKTGVRLLDVFDLHAYPQEPVYNDNVDSRSQQLRIRSTRFLWDPSYVDESWIAQPVKLLPRMKEWVGQSYPGRGISLGEWSFGGEKDMSGGLAMAEALGRFGQAGLTSAFYWTSPPPNSPGLWAFRAYRNFDGKGGRFLDWSTPTTVQRVGKQSLFASRDDAGGHLVAVALNFAPDDAFAAEIDVGSCGKVTSVDARTYSGGAAGLVPATAAQGSATSGTTIKQTLPPYSITVLDVQLEGAPPVTK